MRPGDRHESIAAPRPTIAELCARHHNENPHTEHVARLALALFDPLRESLGLERADRVVLAAAARLHDVGFSVDARHHPQVSAAIVAREGLRGFRAGQLRAIATIIPLHAGPFREALPAPRLARLAALLRIADALDHGHVQDAEIVRVTRSRSGVRVRVRSLWFPYNLTQAGIKADLWRAVCPGDIQFVPPPGAGPRRSLLVVRGLHPCEAARRLLSLPFKTMTSNVAGILAARSSEPLHDFRVAVRRFRAALRVFRKQLPTEVTRALEDDLGRLSRALGSARDHDVWLDFLQGPPGRAALGTGPAAARFLGFARDQRRLDQVTVRRHLRGRPFTALKQRIAGLVRTELPRLVATTPARPPLHELAAKHQARAVAKIVKEARLRRSPEPRKLHQLRVTMRRARYLGELFGDLLGPRVVKQTQRIKKAEQTLGRIHDLNVSLARLRVEGPAPPRALVRLLLHERRAAQQLLDRAWKRLAL